jgi:GT2 family glycosyltransferase
LQKTKHKVAVVILNYNGSKHLEQFLPSVIAHTSAHDIIIADNASTDDSIAFLQENHPDIRIIRNSQNGGFASGYNDALKIIDAEYYVLLNSDLEVTENWITPMLEILEKDSEISGVQPVVNAFLDKNKFEHAGSAGGFLDVNYFPFCRGRIFDKIEENDGQYNTDIEIFWATGACMMIRSADFHSVGGFDESFFAHMEEIDLCWRLKKKGKKFYVAGQSKVYHLGGGTLSYMSPRKTFLNFRNSLFMITKNHDGLLLPMIIKRLCLDGLATFQFLFSGHFRHIFSLLHAHVSFYKHLPELLKKRKALAAQRKNVRLTGLYRKSIILDRYLRKKQRFSDLHSTDFNY